MWDRPMNITGCVRICSITRTHKTANRRCPMEKPRGWVELQQKFVEKRFQDFITVWDYGWSCIAFDSVIKRCFIKQYTWKCVREIKKKKKITFWYSSVNGSIARNSNMNICICNPIVIEKSVKIKSVKKLFNARQMRRRYEKNLHTYMSALV